MMTFRFVPPSLCRLCSSPRKSTGSTPAEEMCMFKRVDSEPYLRVRVSSTSMGRGGGRTKEGTNVEVILIFLV